MSAEDKVAARGAAGANADTDVSSAVEKSKKKKDKETAPQASVSDTLGFAFNCGAKTKILFFIGCLAGIGNGLVFPGLAWLFSNSFSDLSSATLNGLGAIEEIAFYFMGFGAYALVMAAIQAGSFEIVAYEASMSLRLKWFHALLRQDSAFFDVYDIAGLSSNINPSANRYRRGLGRKFGEGIQFGVTALGGLVYAFYASWRVALVILAGIPLMAGTASLVVFYNQSKTTRAAKAYSRAGSVAYSSVSAIRTVLSLNAVPTMIKQYTEATKQAYDDAIGVLLKQGFANGSMLGSFILLYCILALYGTYLLYSDVDETGCDPTGGIDTNETCSSSGPDVFGAMLGVAFAGQGVSQVGTSLGTFTAARVATFEALKAINRTQGAKEETIYEEEKEMSSDSTHSRKSSKSKKSDIESGEKKVKAILPVYQIDSSSTGGQKPSKVEGRLTFENVHFTYPTRPADPILKGLDLDIEAGKTVAFVGPSGGGKSTVVKMLERFYDPTQGSIKLDGVDIKSINVRHYRSLIGYVGQEPTLFATSIAQNIRYGNPSATQEQIEEAARMANAHDFITSFSDGYDTQVGDKGAQLSGGQKQRIAIARVLVADPTILLLDEATSALDSESELVVQEALDNVLASRSRTTCIIAHRLSTIRNADVIAVVSSGAIVEKGTHEELMEAPTGYYRKLVEKQDASGLDSMSRTSSSTSLADSRESSETDLAGMAETSESIEQSTPLGATVLEFDNVTFAYPTRLKKRVLKDFSLNICNGETVALVGPSGGGKSTTVALIERFYDPLEGAMKYKDHDVKTLNPRWYRDQIGYVGQEPVLFNDTIAENIRYGAPGATREEIIEACKQSNAHDFIMTFPQGYETMVGERGTQISGGQKQRIAIARALVKKPKILLLDEATSALDNESEGIVQAALDKLMASKNHTCVVIAHRLSTIRNATRIAFIADGHVKEFGSHDELMEKPKGRYRRLVESQKRKATAAVLGLQTTSKAADDEAEEEDPEAKGLEEAEKNAFDGGRARRMASADVGYLLIGAFGALLAGGVFPIWGLLFAETIDLLFRPVFPCEEGNVPDGSASCDVYISTIVDGMREDSYVIAIYWACVVAACVIGNMLTFYGFGVASERVNKRVRDQAFSALVRQEVAYFDKQSVGSITSRLQDDAARIHTFIGDPVRSMLVALSSVLTGLVLSFIYMWPFALVGVACVPLMGFASSLEMKQFLGTDEGEDAKDELNSPGGIIVETLLNISTVSALTMEEARFNDFRNALHHAEPNHVKDAIKAGILYGLSQFIQQWINALQFWWGGYIIIELSQLGFSFNDFLVSNFALLFSLFGLGAAFQDIADRKETEASAGRVFYLLDRKSAIDPLSEEGKKLS